MKNALLKLLVSVMSVSMCFGSISVIHAAEPEEIVSQEIQAEDFSEITEEQADLFESAADESVNIETVIPEDPADSPDETAEEEMSDPQADAPVAEDLQELAPQADAPAAEDLQEQAPEESIPDPAPEDVMPAEDTEEELNADVDQTDAADREQDVLPAEDTEMLEEEFAEEEEAYELAMEASVLPASGSLTGTISWYLDEYGSLTISGSGEMGYVGSYGTWRNSSYRDLVTSVVIESGITQIGSNAFFDMGNIRSVSIPGTVTGIDDYAFYDCYSLTDITLPSALTFIGNRAFDNCSSIRSISLPITLQSIGSSAFDSCYSLSVIDYAGSFLQWIDNLSTYSAEKELSGVEVRFADKADIADVEVSISESSYEYTGSAIEPDITVKYGKYQAEEDEDYRVSYVDNTNAGTAQVILEGIGCFTGTRTETFSIVMDLEDCTAEMSKSAVTYNGKERKPAVIVKDGNATLTEGVDYTAAYSYNTEVGTAYVVITGKGKYTGTQELSFEIKKASNYIKLAKTKYTLNAKPTKSQSITLKPKVKGGKVTYESSDYSVKVTDKGKVVIPADYYGKVVITLRVEDYNYKTVSKKVVITVKQTPATKIYFPPEVYVTKGFKKTIVAVRWYESQKLTGLKWKSSKPSVAAVNSKGVVTGKKPGTAIITCTLKNGKKYKCKVKVVKNVCNITPYNQLDFSDSSYGGPALELVRVYYSGKTLVIDYGMYNNRTFYAEKFDWITFTIYIDGKVVNTHKFYNVPIDLQEYDRKPITFRIPMDKVYDIRDGNFYIKYDYYYSYLH